METATVKKILVVVLDNLGDTVMATVLLKPLKRLYPHAQIGLWTKSYVQELFQDQSLIDFHHHCDPFWDKAPGHEKGRWQKFWTTFREIRKIKYDMAYVLNSEWRRAAFVNLAGIPERVGLDRRKSRFFLTTRIPVSPKPQHFIEDHLSLLNVGELGGDDVQQYVPRLELNTEEKKLWNEWENNTKWKKSSYIVVHPFSGDEKKTWPLTCWAELIKSLLENKQNTRFVLLCGPGEEDRLRQLMSNISSDSVRMLQSSRLSLVKAVVAHAALFVGGDSGPGHVAAALDVPVVSLFGSTNPDRSRPIGHAQIKILHKNPIESISVSDVKASILHG